MSSEAKKPKDLSNKSPAVYRIRVQGELDESWSERLGGMTITLEQIEDHMPVTTLKGTLMDQAALSGILNTLYDLRMSVLSVEYLKS